MIEKLKAWLIEKLGGCSKAEYEKMKCQNLVVTPIRHRELRKYRAYYNPQFPSVLRPKDEELIKSRLLWTLAQQMKDKVYFGKISPSYQYTDLYYAELIIAVEE